MNVRLGSHMSKASRFKISKAHLGMHLSRATRLKMSKSHRKYNSLSTRKKISKALKGNTNHEGIYQSKVTKLKISKALKGKPNFKMRGKNHPLWNGGSSFEPYPTTFNERLKYEIRKRDNCTCQLCGKRANTVHHIDYNKKNCTKSNLCVLCKECNGKVNSDRNYWRKFFRKIIHAISTRKRKRIVITRKWK